MKLSTKAYSVTSAEANMIPIQTVTIYSSPSIAANPMLAAGDNLGQLAY